VGGKGDRRVNKVQKMCTYVCKYKMTPFATVSGIWRVKGEQWRGEFK
jgi:hypothetical protein